MSAKRERAKLEVLKEKLSSRRRIMFCKIFGMDTKGLDIIRVRVAIKHCNSAIKRDGDARSSTN